MSLTTAEEIYEHVVKPLPVIERLRLVAKIAHELSAPPSERAAPGDDWVSLGGIAPGLLGGEDAQAWVSRTRREADEQRERQWRREP